MLTVALLAGLLAGWGFGWISEWAAFPAAPVEPGGPGSNAVVSRWALRSATGQATPGLWLHVCVALMSAAMFGIVWLRWGLSWEALQRVVSYGFLVVVALIDLKVRRVPNRLVYPAIVIVLLYQGLAAPQGLAAVLVGGSMAFLIFYLTARLRPGELGGGDIKLAALIGLGFGFPNLIWALLVGAGLGAIAAVALIVRLHWNIKSGIPYAPFLCLGACVAMLYNPLPMWLH